MSETPPAPEVPHRAMITVCIIGATLLQALDQTISISALPYMQGTFSASYTEMTWVVTSYIIAAAIMTAPVGWLAARFGRKMMFVVCILGFTTFSICSGAAQTLQQLIICRLIQGMFSAALVPLSQATLLDIYPFERRGFAMAIWGIGVMLGPIMGPSLGGYLTDAYNWRAVFYISTPFGLMAALGLLVFMPRAQGQSHLRFDWLGFALLGIAIGALQLMLDRGRRQDWFSSQEILIEGVLAGLCFYLFIVHMLYAPRPMIRPVLFKDRNFSLGLCMMFAVGTVLVSSLTMMTPWLQVMSNYPVATAGLIMAPRGIGNLVTIALSGRLAPRMDPRWLVGIGMSMMCVSFWVMTGWTPDVSATETIVVIMVQGAGLGLVFTPLQLLSFTTLNPALITEGAALFSLLRNIGAAIGVSVTATVLATNTQGLHEVIGAHVTPFNRALQDYTVMQTYLDPGTAKGVALLDNIVTFQSQIVAYSNNYVLLICTTLPALLLLLLMRGPQRGMKLGRA